MAILQAATSSGAEHTLRCTNEGSLVTQSIQEPELEHASGKGDAWSFDSTELDIDAGDTMLFIRNDDDRPFLVDRLIINGSNVVCTWDVNVGTSTATAAGTTITPVNLNTRFSGASIEMTAMSDETGHADGSTINRVKTAVSEHVELDMAGIVIQKNHWLQVNQETESTSGSVIVLGHYQDAIT